MDVQTQAWTNPFLHLPKLKSKHLHSCSPETNKQQGYVWAHGRADTSLNKIADVACMFLHAPRSKNAASSAENTRGHKDRTLHSARPLNAVNIRGFRKMVRNTNIYIYIYTYIYIYMYISRQETPKSVVGGIGTRTQQHESTHRRAHRWEHIYQSTRGAHIYESTRMRAQKSAHLWEQ